MRFHKTLTVLLIDLPFRLRLGIVVLAYLLCLAMFALVFLPSHNGSILAIPLALSSWMFKRRGALIGLGCTLLALVILNSLSVGGIVWPPALALTFLSGSLALLVEVVIISLLRHALDMVQALDLAQAAQLKAQQAEQQLALAYKHQRQLNDLKDCECEPRTAYSTHRSVWIPRIAQRLSRRPGCRHAGDVPQQCQVWLPRAHTYGR